MHQQSIRHAMLLAAILVGSGVDRAFAFQGDANLDFRSGISPGTRVVLIEDVPALGEDLKAGRAGTVLCCDANDCSGSLLVSWDLWNGGQDEEGRCVAAPSGAYPAGSATWVDPQTVLLGRAFDEVGILREVGEGCLYLETERGELLYLVIDERFREQWSFVLPGNRVRVRGWFNTNEPDPNRACAQRDGDVYHPIMTDAEWTGESCCDPFLCSFMYGDSVVLIGEDDPNGAVDLPRGTSGTIICCNCRAENSVLVSWNFWTHGGDPNNYLQCNERLAGIFPVGSTWWVPVQDLAKYVKTDCGTLQEIRLCSDGECPDISGVALFVETQSLYYLPDLGELTPVPSGQFLASGLYSPYATLPDGLVVGEQHALAEVILHSVLFSCPTLGCCKEAYAPGDRVRLLVDEPGGAPNLFAGAGGKVICCNSTDPNTPVLVSWDLWEQGHDDDENCNCCERPGWYRDNSAWWMSCKEIEPATVADLYDLGEAYRGFAPSSVIAGQPNQGFRVTGEIGNRGGRQSDVFFVEIYASADDQITSDDYFIGLVGMDIDAGGVSDLSWSGEFPTEIPAGTYHIGWLIDPDNFVNEGKEGEKNNTAVIEAGTLTVLAP